MIDQRVLCLEKITHSAVSRLDPKKTAVIATLSPLEVHGPHLPIGQDMMQAYELAGATAELVVGRRKDWTFLLLPPVPVAADALPRLGSISFPVSMVHDVACQLMEPFARAGFERLAFASFHGGPRHLCALESAAETIRKKHNIPTVSLMSAALSRLLEGDSFMEGLKDVKNCAATTGKLREDHHAAFVETSIALHLWPDLVEDGWRDLPDSVPNGSGGHDGTNGSFLYGYGGRASAIERLRRTVASISSLASVIGHFKRNTYYGYPSIASAEAGKALFEHLADISAGLVEELIDRGMEMDGHSPLWKFRGILLNPLVNKAADNWLSDY